jgi:hypothetical protein
MKVLFFQAAILWILASEPSNQFTGTLIGVYAARAALP